MQGKSNPGLRIIGSVITRYDARSKINRYWKDAIAERGAETGAPLLATIRAGVAIKEAKAFRLSLFDYAPRSNPARDYKKLYDLIQEV
jgi:chromosome partitioning protein